MTEQGNFEEPSAVSSDKTPATSLRLRMPEDDACIVAIYNAQEADSLPLTLERYRREHPLEGAEPAEETWVAAQGKRVVGYGSFQPAWWTGDPGIYQGEIRVEAAHQRRGIGTRLFHQLRKALLHRQASQMFGWVRYG